MSSGFCSSIETGHNYNTNDGDSSWNFIAFDASSPQKPLEKIALCDRHQETNTRVNEPFSHRSKTFPKSFLNMVSVKLLSMIQFRENN